MIIYLSLQNNLAIGKQMGSSVEHSRHSESDATAPSMSEDCPQRGDRIHSILSVA